MWLVHAAMSSIFAGLLFAMWVRIRRPLVGWLAAFFLAHLVTGLLVATYWWGGLVSPAATACLAVLIGSAVIAVVPVLQGAYRELQGTRSPSRRAVGVWLVGGAIYGGVAASLILQIPDRPDLLITLGFRPVGLTAAFAPLYIFRRTLDVLPRNRVAADALRAGLFVAAGLAIVEAAFRAQVGIADQPAFAITATVVTNLLSILLLGIAALLSTLAQGRADLRAALDQEMQLSRQEAQAARLESLGRLAAGIAHDFNGVFDEASQRLSAARRQWQNAPDEALDELRGVKEAVQRGTHITTALLRLSRHHETAPRRIAPAARLKELLPVLTRMINHAQSLQVDLSARHEVIIAPARFDQLVLNVLVAAMETGQSRTALRVSLHDVTGSDLPVDAFDTRHAAVWLRLRVSCEEEAGAASPAETVEASASRAAARRPANRALSAALGHTTSQLATEAVGGHVRVMPSATSCATIEVWLPALSSVDSAQAHAFSPAFEGNLVTRAVS